MDRFDFRTPLAIIAISISLFTQSALAEQELAEITVGNDFGVGARAMGMGGAFIGVADDSTALHWNPAGLSQIKRMEFYGALSHEKLETETEYFGSFDSTFVARTQPSSFGVVLPVPVYRGGLAFAFGVNRIQNFDSRVSIKGFNDDSVEENPEFGQLFVDELSDRSGDIYSWNFGAAVDIAPDVRVGGVLSFLSGDHHYELELDADDTADLDSELTGFSYRDLIDSDYFGIEAKIGLLARPIPQIRLGATLNFPLDFSVDEYWSQESFYLYDDGEDESWYDDGVFSYDISRPVRLGGGIAAHPLPGAIIAADVLYTDWTQTEYSEPPSEDVSNEDFIDDYRATVQLRIGGEYTIPSMGLRVRAGYQRDPLPYTPEGVSIDTDRQFITVGFGMVLGEVLSLDVAYMRGFWKESIDDSPVNKDRDSNRIFISTAYRF